ncbi:1-acyl-sn-glycerol-3-phosphate acyltransferase [Flavobacterium sp. NRK F10]|uniref:1-acyl-sn-glycerol-3-phosphate acyltransferase n=1 Tax=Flavobacterium sp. NRK F10 TaxID=2954931 RepID=UPI0020913D7B|nr:1-acyl-sn-glycerol-3-phosphate acyltransferase [Flavobacterium sp. NRK F10]MCO6176346.1 1-acyl-sn-glycerol-3-phosphate acyltransferase [Flavobacterium sp. NRK F10]
MKQILYKFIFFRLMGWKITGLFPADIKKCIIIVVPHTSWNDFFIGVFTRGILNLEMNFVAKKELFTFPLGFYFRWMGGAPLNRAKNENKVDAIASIFDKKEVFRLAIAPEGTRKKVTDWKTGFYYIAQKANVPIMPVAFDYEHKEVKIFEPYYLTSDKDKDFDFLQNLFRGIKGKYPEKSF